MDIIEKVEIICELDNSDTMTCVASESGVDFHIDFHIASSVIAVGRKQLLELRELIDQQLK